MQNVLAASIAEGVKRFVYTRCPVLRSHFDLLLLSAAFGVIGHAHLEYHGLPVCASSQLVERYPGKQRLSQQPCWQGAHLLPPPCIRFDIKNVAHPLLLRPTALRETAPWSTSSSGQSWYTTCCLHFVGVCCDPILCLTDTRLSRTELLAARMRTSLCFPSPSCGPWLSSASP